MKVFRITFSMLIIMSIAFGLSFGQESRPAGNTGSGPFVKNGKLYDKNGCRFVPRGVNLPAGWHDYGTSGTMYNEIDNIAAWGFNSLRIVWSAGISGTGTEEWSQNQTIIYNIIEKCIQEGMIPMLELHDGTGSNRTDWLEQMAQWYANNKSWLDDFDDNLIINIANEWGNHSLAATTWRDAYQNAITTIRNSGLKNCLVIDGKEWAKDISVIQQYGSTLVNHDPQHNIAFGVHYYCGTGESSTTIRNNLEWADNNGICLMVGEFAAQHDNYQGGMCNVQEETIVNECNQNGQGYYWWAWETGNDGVFDLTTVWNSTSYNQLTALGKWLIVDSPDGIQQTSFKASNLGGPLCSGGGTDAITTVSGPTTVSAGEDITVQVGYEASTNRDVYVSFQLDESPYTVYGTGKADVSNGSGTANVSLTVDNAAPSGTNYKYQTYITTDDGGWSERLANDSQDGITISGGSGGGFAIPGKIEAENYTSMSGIQTQTTSDVGGGENVGWINAGDWLDYTVNVATAGQYDVTFRLASLSNGAKFDLKNESTVLTSVNEPATGGWQTWTSVTKTVTLSAGTQTLRILATGDGWNYNWMEFTEASAPATYTLGVTNGSGDGNYEEGTVVNISANAAPTGQQFDAWTGDVANVADVNNANTSITMPSENTSITATYKDIPSGEDGTITVRAALTSGSSDVLELRLDDVTVKSWTIGSSYAEYSHSGISGSKDVKIYFQDNGTNAKLDYINVNGTIYQAEDQADNTAAWDGSCGGGSYTENMHCAGYIGFGTLNFGGDTQAPTYTLSVTNGSGDGDYAEGTAVNITANAAPGSQVFAGWTGDISYLENANNSSTTVTMPSSNVNVAASYEDAPSSNKYEAEDATLTGCSTASSVSGFSGTGYVNGTTFTNPDKISWSVNGITAGSYDIIIGYNGSMGTKEQELIINGSSQGNISFSNISDWTTVNAGSYNLNTNNTIELKASWGWMHVDYIELVSLKQGITSTNPEENLIQTGIKVYPNPVDHSGVLHLSHNYEIPVVVKISDVQGKLVYSQKHQNEQVITIPTEGLKQGLYILQANETVRKIIIK
ncbi:MAG: carbohydrate-binding protein [Bacteroidota bacterium]